MRWCPEFWPGAAGLGKQKEAVHMCQDHTLMPGATREIQMNHADIRARTLAELQAQGKPWTCAKRKVEVTNLRCALDKIAAVRGGQRRSPCHECGLPQSLKWVTRADLGLETKSCERG